MGNTVFCYRHIDTHSLLVYIDTIRNTKFALKWRVSGCCASAFSLVWVLRIIPFCFALSTVLCGDELTVKYNMRVR